AVTAAVDAAKRAGRPVFDRVLETPWQRTGTVEQDYDRLLGRIEPGLTYMALHFNAAGDIDVIAPQEEGIRPAELAFFRSEAFRERVAARGLELIGMRAPRGPVGGPTRRRGGGGGRPPPVNARADAAASPDPALVRVVPRPHD